MYRIYLFAAALKMTFWGIVMMGPNKWTSSSSMNVVKEVLPAHAWGILFVMLSLGFALAFVQSLRIQNKNKLMNILPSFAVTINVIWALGYILAGFQGDLVNAVIPAMFLWVAMSHFIISQMPMADEQMFNNNINQPT
jgi:hypothetical protein